MSYLSQQDKNLIRWAVEARERAYAPYSHFQVGAALQTDEGAVYTGVNVENCSYGLCMCAERNAVAAAVRAGVRPGALQTVAVVADAASGLSPCGACRQVLREFGTDATRVVLHNLRDEHTRVVTLGELLPMPFTPDALPPTG